jgi:hypothetical protein
MEQITELIFGVGFIGSPFYLLYLWQNHAPPRGRMWAPKMQVTTARRIFSFIFGSISLLSGIYLLPSFFAIFGIVISIPLLGYAIGGKKALKLIPDWSEFYDDIVRKEELETKEQTISDSDDPNIKLQSLLTDIEKSVEKLNQSWQDTIIARTKEIQLSLPIEFYRNDREILGKYYRNLNEKWTLFGDTQSEKSYFDLIQVLDNLIYWMKT